MTLHDYVATLRRHWLVIALCTVLGAAGSAAYALTLPAQYSSRSSVMVIPERGENTADLVQGSNYVQNLVQSYAVLAASPYVLAPVIDELGLSLTPTALARQVDVSTPLNTVVIEISVVDGDPAVAQEVSDAVATELARAVGELSPEGADSRPAVRLETIAPAKSPTAPIAPDKKLYTALGAAVGLLLGVGYALLRRLLGMRVGDADDLATWSDVPVLGEVVRAGRGTTVPATVLTQPHGRVAESLRTVAANLRFVGVEDAVQVMLVTSGSPGEGKSSVATGLALSLAEAGNRVLLVDADLRRPAVGRFTQLDASVGLTTVLIGDAPLEEAVQAWGPDGLHVLTSGAPAPNPGRLLSSGALRAVVEEARRRYDYVVLDSAPLLSVSDPLWLSPLTDGVIVAARVGTTSRQRLSSTLARLDSAQATTLGVVLNGVRRSDRNAYYDDPARHRLRRPAPGRVPAPARVVGVAESRA